MPTSSIRFEKWGAKSIEAWGLHMIIGKTTMGSETIEMMRKRLCVHVSPQGVSPNLWTSSIEIEGVELFEELGSIEATWHLKLNRLGPFIVDIDTNGDNFFQKRDAELLENRRKAYELLGIPLDFEYTRLYYEFDKEGK
jgi:L(+)-tartrate dehydratase beta subunit